VLHQVGAGGLGPVFRAHDPAQGRLVAIKAFRLDLVPERARDLARALQDVVDRGVDHPGLARSVAAGVEGGIAWFAQAYIAAESLEGVLRQYGPPSLGDALVIVQGLAAAIDAAAERGVIHGALHPRDVLVAGEEAHVIDCGVAQALEQVGVHAPIRRPYSAPERVDGRDWNRPADIFSIAALAYELLAGRRIAGPGEQHLPRSLFTGANHGLLVEAFAAALSVDPRERPPTATKFASVVATSLEHARQAAARPDARPAAAAAAPRVLPLELALEADEPPLTTLDDFLSETESAVVPRVDEVRRREPEIRVDDVAGPAVVYATPAADTALRAREAESQVPFDEPEMIEGQPLEPAAMLAGPPQTPGGWWRFGATLGVGLALGFAAGVWFAGRPATTAGNATRIVVPRDAPPVATAPSMPSTGPGSPAPQVVAEAEPRKPAPTPPAPAVRDQRPADAVSRQRASAPPVTDAGGRSRTTAARATPAPRPRQTTGAAPAGRTGVVSFATRPMGARVYFDDRFIGTTPLVKSDVPPGTYPVRFELPGHATWSTTVRVTAGQRSRVSASLESRTEG
jgi:PEGA domain/Protein kinase domain